MKCSVDDLAESASRNQRSILPLCLHDHLSLTSCHDGEYGVFPSLPFSRRMKTVMFVLFSFSRGGGGVADFIVSFACANLVATLTCITSASRLAFFGVTRSDRYHLGITMSQSREGEVLNASSKISQRMFYERSI